MLDGALGYRPWQQGNLDGLCGVYAAINAIGVVVAPLRPLRRCDARYLMKSGIRYLHRREALKKAAVEGMGVERQHKITRHLTSKGSARAGVQIEARTFTDEDAGNRRDLLFQAIEDSLERGAAVIVSLENKHDHYTVIVGYTATRFYLSDSDGLRWLSKACFGPCEGRVHYTNCVNLTEMLEVGVPR